MRFDCGSLKWFNKKIKSISFDVFSSKFTDYEKPDNLYVDPSSLLDEIDDLTNNLIIYNNYNSYQLMVVLYKEKLNGWKLTNSSQSDNL